MAGRDLAIRLLISARDRASGVVRGVWSSVKSGARGAQSAIRRVGRAFGSWQAKVVGLITSLVSLKAATDAIGEVARLESLTVQLEALEGSAKAAQERLAQLDQSFETGLLDKATGAYIGLRRFGIEPTMAQVRGLLDTNAKLGGSQETLNGIILALGQAWSKQKLQGEEILQLVERGVPVWDLLASATGRNVAELQKLSTQGKLGRDVISALIDEMGRTSEGAATKGLRTWVGLTDAFGETWRKLQRTLLSGGLFDWIKGKLDDVNAVLEYAVTSGTAERWAEQIKNAVIDAGTWANGFLRLMQGVINGIRVPFNALQVVVESVRGIIVGALATISRALAKVFETVWLDKWAADARAAAELMESVFDEKIGAVKANFEELGNAVGGLKGAFEDSGNWWGDLVEEARKAREETQAQTRAVNDMEKAGKAAGDALKAGAGAAASGLSETEQQAKSLEDRLKSLKDRIEELRDVDDGDDKDKKATLQDVSKLETQAVTARVAGDLEGAAQYLERATTALESVQQAGGASKIRVEGNAEILARERAALEAAVKDAQQAQAQTVEPQLDSASAAEVRKFRDEVSQPIVVPVQAQIQVSGGGTVTLPAGTRGSGVVGGTEVDFQRQSAKSGRQLP